MTLAMAGCAGRNNDLAGRINAHLRSFERTDAGALDITADADTEISSTPAEILLLLTQLFVSRCFERLRHVPG